MRMHVDSLQRVVDHRCHQTLTEMKFLGKLKHLCVVSIIPLCQGNVSVGPDFKAVLKQNIREQMLTQRSSSYGTFQSLHEVNIVEPASAHLDPWKVMKLAEPSAQARSQGVAQS